MKEVRVGNESYVTSSEKRDEEHDRVQKISVVQPLKISLIVLAEIKILFEVFRYRLCENASNFFAFNYNLKIYQTVFKDLLNKFSETTTRCFFHGIFPH